MPRNPNRYPHTPEGLAQKERDMTKNSQPVGLGQHAHSKLFTKEKFLEHTKQEIIAEELNTKKNIKKVNRGSNKVRGDSLRSAANIKNLSQMIIEYSLKPESLDMHGFMRNIGLSPRKLLEMTESDQELATAYELAKSNFAYNNLMFLRKKYNQVALNKSAIMHATFSEFLKVERRNEKSHEKRIALEAMYEINELRKAEISIAPEPQIIVKLEY